MTTQDLIGSVTRQSKPEIWDDELWKVLGLLYSRLSDQSLTPRIALTANLCPAYTDLLSRNRMDVNKALMVLEGIILEISWNSSRMSARWVRLKYGMGETLKELILAYRPGMIERANLERQRLSQDQIAALADAIDCYGPMGLRTAAHLVLGDSHALDNLVVPELQGLWRQSDVTAYGASSGANWRSLLTSPTGNPMERPVGSTWPYLVGVGYSVRRSFVG